MKKTIFFSLSLIVGIALFVGVVWKVGWASIVGAIERFSLFELLFVVFLAAVQQMVSVYRWHLILKSQGHNLAFLKLFMAKLVGFSVDYTTPSPNIGGETIRAYVVQKESDVKFSTSLASIIIDKVMDFSYALPFVIFGIGYVLVHYDITAKSTLLLILVALGFVLLLGAFYIRTLSGQHFFGPVFRVLQLHRIPGVGKVIDKMKSFEDVNISFFRDHRRLLYGGLLLSLIAGSIAIGQYYFILTSLNLSVSLLTVLIIATLTIITYLLPIPASLGSQETGLALVFSVLGFGPQVGIAYSFIIRVPEAMKVAFGYAYLSHFGIRLTRKILQKGQPNGENVDGNTID